MRKIDPERVAQQRREIVEASMRCFARDGVQAATTDQICREAGISPGRLYYYFASKEQIVEAVARDFNDAVHLNLGEDLGSGDLLDALNRHTVDLKAEMERRGVSMALALELFSQAGRAPGVQAAVQDGAGRRISALRAALELRKHNGLLRQEADIDALSAAIAALYSGMDVLSLTDPNFDLQRYRRAADMVLRPWLEASTGG
jgi:AcrR family transcriptional regulator